MKKPLVERQGLLTNLANARAWIAAVRKNARGLGSRRKKELARVDGT